MFKIGIIIALVVVGLVAGGYWWGMHEGPNLIRISDFTVDLVEDFAWALAWALGLGLCLSLCYIFFFRPDNALKVKLIKENDAKIAELQNLRYQYSTEQEKIRKAFVNDREDSLIKKRVQEARMEAFLAARRQIEYKVENRIRQEVCKVYQQSVIPEEKLQQIKSKPSKKTLTYVSSNGRSYAMLREGKPTDVNEYGLPIKPI